MSLHFAVLTFPTSLSETVRCCHDTSQVGGAAPAVPPLRKGGGVFVESIAMHPAGQQTALLTSVAHRGRRLAKRVKA